MKMLCKFKTPLLLILMSLVGCQTKEELSNPAGGDNQRDDLFVIKLDMPVKTINDGVSTDWVEGDKVNVFHALTGTEDFICDGAFEYRSTGEFVGIPMLRMSEMYLIAMETTTDLAQANELYTTYMNSCACTVLPESAYTTLEDVKAEVINEYRREFVAEGQMFYQYKRMNATSMLWSDDVLTEESYIIPLPRTEYNPEHLNQ